MSSTNKTIGIGTAIALGMVTLFTLGSPGLALIVTFVPGVALAWMVFVHLVLSNRPLPQPKPFLIWFGIALAIQFLHFAEEYVADFPGMFGPLYGGQPIDRALFVSFNMASYSVFLLSALMVAFRGVRPLLVPALFFAIYGVAGNAVAHLLWAIVAGGYFPGLITSLAYWMLALPLMRQFGLSWRESGLVGVVFAGLLLLTAGLTMQPSTIAP